MIKYNLTCKNCSNEFDNWFSSSSKFEKIKKLNLLNCDICGSKKIIKSIMSPNLNNAKKNKTIIDNNLKEIKDKMKKYQKFIKENFKYVGENFPYEARSLHYNNKKEQKGIFGKASYNEVKELKEEGIETEMIPWIEDKDN